MPEAQNLPPFFFLRDCHGTDFVPAADAHTPYQRLSRRPVPSLALCLAQGDDEDAEVQVLMKKVASQR